MGIIDFQFSEDGKIIGYISDSNNLLKIYFIKDDEIIDLLDEEIDFFYFIKTNNIIVFEK